jgi:hypothetical protein
LHQKANSLQNYDFSPLKKKSESMTGSRPWPIFEVLSQRWPSKIRENHRKLQDIQPVIEPGPPEYEISTLPRDRPLVCTCFSFLLPSLKSQAMPLWSLQIVRELGICKPTSESLQVKMWNWSISML